MPIRTPCPNCRTIYAFADHLAGKNVRCKNCDEIIAVRPNKRSAEEVESGDDTGAREKVRAGLSKPLPARRVEEPVRKRRQRDEEADLRRSNRGLLIWAIAGGAALALLLGGGAIVAIVLLAGRSGNKTADANAPNALVDFGDSWPAPRQLRAAANVTVTIHVGGVGDEYTRQAASDKIEAILSSGGSYSMSASSKGDRMTVTAAPVRDVKALAQKMDFGTVSGVDGRTITVIARKVEGPPPNADSVTKALYLLKSISANRRADGVRKLKEALPDERRGEVVKALEPLLTDANLSLRKEAIEALAVWGDKESLPLLLKAMRDKDTRKAAMLALGRLKDERAAEPIAERLDDIFERGEAVEALKRMGPAAEKAVLARLHHRDALVRQTVCDLLKEIGTDESVPALEKVVAEKNAFVSPKAKEAIEAINARR